MARLDQGVATEDEGVLRTGELVGDGHGGLELRAGVEEPVAGAERQEVDEPVRKGRSEQALDHERPHQEAGDGAGAVPGDHADAEPDHRGQGDVEQRPQRPGGDGRGVAHVDAAEQRSAEPGDHRRWRRAPARPWSPSPPWPSRSPSGLGRAISVTARVPCWASAVNMRIPVTMASVAMSGRGKMNSSDAVSVLLRRRRCQRPGDERADHGGEGEDHLVGPEGGQLDPLAPAGRPGPCSRRRRRVRSAGAVAGRPGDGRAGGGHGSGSFGRLAVGVGGGGRVRRR